MKIPAGVDDGSRIRLSGSGEAGLRNGPDGDLYVYLSVRKHDTFKRDGLNIFGDVPISFPARRRSAARSPSPRSTASTAAVPGRHADRYDLPLARPRHAGGARRRRAATIVATVRVAVPTKLGKRERELLEEFARAGEDEDGDRSFFDRVKEAFKANRLPSLRDRFFVEGYTRSATSVPLARRRRAQDRHRAARTQRRSRAGARFGRHAFSASIDVTARASSARLDERLERGARETAVRLTVAQAIPKGQKMDLVVEKATDSASRRSFRCAATASSASAPGAEKIERWQRLARSAAQQCGRTMVPEIAPVTAWDGLLASFAAYDRVYIPWELADVRPLRETFDADAPQLTSALFVIGPEGGFSSHEVERAVAAGAVPISLGTRILRTETVALVVLAAFAYARGEL